MIRRIAGSVHYSLIGVKKLEVIQVKPPSPARDQEEEQDGQVWNDLLLQPSIGLPRLNRRSPKYT